MSGSARVCPLNSPDILADFFFSTVFRDHVPKPRQSRAPNLSEIIDFLVCYSFFLHKSHLSLHPEGTPRILIRESFQHLVPRVDIYLLAQYIVSSCSGYNHSRSHSTSLQVSSLVWVMGKYPTLQVQRRFLVGKRGPALYIVSPLLSKMGMIHIYS